VLPLNVVLLAGVMVMVLTSRLLDHEDDDDQLVQACERR
jgi:hypothetical protein